MWACNGGTTVCILINLNFAHFLMTPLHCFFLFLAPAFSRSLTCLSFFRHRCRCNGAAPNHATSVVLSGWCSIWHQCAPELAKYTYPDLNGRFRAEPCRWSSHSCSASDATHLRIEHGTTKITWLGWCSWFGGWANCFIDEPSLMSPDNDHPFSQSFDHHP